MQSIRRQIASEIRKGTVQRTAKGSSKSHKPEDITNKSQCIDDTMPKLEDISLCTELACTDSDTASLEAFDLQKHNSSMSEHSLPTGNENNSPLSTPSNPALSQELKWDELDSDLQLVLPADEKYTYVVETYHQKQKLEFQGSPNVAFEAKV